MSITRSDINLLRLATEALSYNAAVKAAILNTLVSLTHSCSKQLG